MLGRPDQARDTAHATLTLAQELAHPMGLALALFFTTLIHWLRREGQPTGELAGQLLAIAREHGMADYQAVAVVWRGWSLGEAGASADAVAQVRQGAAALRITGAELYRTVTQAMLAEALGRQGQAEEGLTALAEALALVHRGGERYWEAELHRIQGELLLRRRQAGLPVQAEAEQCFRRAIAVARGQQAKALELRAVLSLARLHQQQGRPAEGKPLLAETYGWFTEGFATGDLQEAQALLEQLS